MLHWNPRCAKRQKTSKTSPGAKDQNNTWIINNMYQNCGKDSMLITVNGKVLTDTSKRDILIILHIRCI